MVVTSGRHYVVADGKMNFRKRGRRNRLDVNTTAVRRANLFANRDGPRGGEKRGRGREEEEEGPVWEGGQWGHRVAEGGTARGGEEKDRQRT